jgi:hypothetical protein
MPPEALACADTARPTAARTTRCKWTHIFAGEAVLVFQFDFLALDVCVEFFTRLSQGGRG